MGWVDELRAAVSAPEGVSSPSEGEAIVVVGGREITVPAPIVAGELVQSLGSNTPADTMYIVVSEAGRKIPADEEIPPGARVFLVPVRVDG